VDALRERDRGQAQVVVERGADLAAGEDADDDREEQQDHERQPGRGERQPPANRQSLEPVHCVRIT
jgi:hypothetical protein